MIEKAVGVRSSNRRLAFVCWRSPRLYNLLRDKNEKKIFSYCIKPRQTQSYTKLLKHQNPFSLCQTTESHRSIRNIVSQKNHKCFLHTIYTPYYKMATILVVFCLPSN